jgi:DNA-binding response OmpR family regulator
VLVVDGESWWRDLVYALLSEQGMDVTGLAELDRGLTETGKGEYDIVLISDRVLDEPAFEARLQRHLKAQPGQQIVLVSATPDWQKTREAFLFGAADHITKSVEVDEVLSALAPHL